MASGPACQPVVAEPLSRLVAPRAVSAFPPDYPFARRAETGSTNACAAGREPKSMNSGRQAEKPGRACFPRAARLLNPIEFKRVFKLNSVSSDRYFRVLARPNEAPYCRLGMAVSRQIDKRAVGRNRIKRVVRESFRRFFNRPTTLPENSLISADSYRGINSFVDLVVLPRRECATICNRQLFQSLEAHWSRISDSIEKNDRAANPDPG
jgi:ribonuclease P protein component